MPCAAKTLPSLEYLNAALRLDAETGQLFWNRRPISHFTSATMAQAWNKRHAGQRADKHCTDGYRRVTITINGKTDHFGAHRIVWKMANGTEPPQYLDHIDRNKANNRAGNLREATHSLNMSNRRRGPGITLVGSKHRARIKLDGKYKHLGYFTTRAAAEAAITAAEGK